ncbi:heavy-metal-associated domain-containing protein [Citrifermentans bremense]|uniref:heavy-metal-associated domain-containing protein n=1 Tax=Citrifermentans bremense TaxID=60035 RepID=UPI000417C085|nr:heavy-metal-associated domain-containing protein [Citrifermentans bremense]
MVVASLLNGRVRVRDEGLKKQPLLSRVTEALIATPGVTSAEANTRVGSLLVFYDAALAAAEQILKRISELLDSPQEAPPSAEAEAGGATSRHFPFSRGMSLSILPALRRRVVNYGMLAALALSVGAAIIHFKKLHVLTGIVFLALFGDHLYQRRGQMFA